LSLWRVARRTARCIAAIETRSTVPSPQQVSEYFLFYPTVPAADIEWIASDGPPMGYGCHLLVDDGRIKAPCPLQGPPEKPQTAHLGGTRPPIRATPTVCTGREAGNTAGINPWGKNLGIEGVFPLPLPWPLDLVEHRSQVGSLDLRASPWHRLWPCPWRPNQNATRSKRLHLSFGSTCPSGQGLPLSGSSPTRSNASSSSWLANGLRTRDIGGFSLPAPLADRPRPATCPRFALSLPSLRHRHTAITPHRACLTAAPSGMKGTCVN
jgi:hypothetical protein